MINVTIKGGIGLFLGLKKEIPRTMHDQFRIVARRSLEAIRVEIRAFAKNRTGALEESYRIKYVTEAKGYDVARIESSSVYARIHETGGTIWPIRAKMLAIPKTARARSMPPRSMPGAFIPRGRDVIVTRGGAGGGLTVHYVLRSSVTLKAQRYLTKAAARSREIMKDTMGYGIKSAIEKATAKAKSKSKGK